MWVDALNDAGRIHVRSCLIFGIVFNKICIRFFSCSVLNLNKTGCLKNNFLLPVMKSCNVMNCLFTKI